jgi:TPR repeat protein
MKRYLIVIAALAVSAAVAAGARADVGAAWQAYLAGSYATALEQLQAPAAGGSAEAQYALGSLYSDGLAVPRDYRKAAEWFQRAAEQGLAKAQFSLGFLTYYGAGQDESEGALAGDRAAAARWLAPAAKAGYAMAQYLLCTLYHDGEGVPMDREIALRWALAAAEQDLTEAQYEAGYLLGSKMDLSAERGAVVAWIEAYKWFLIAARKGVPRAEQNLAILAKRLEPDEIAIAEDMARDWRPVD